MHKAQKCDTVTAEPMSIAKKIYEPCKDLKEQITDNFLYLTT